MNKGYYDPPRTSPFRCVEWIAPKRKGHREFSAPLPAKVEA